MADGEAVKVGFLFGVSKFSPGEGQSAADVGAAKINLILKNSLPEKGIHRHFEAIKIDRAGKVRPV